MAKYRGRNIADVGIANPRRIMKKVAPRSFADSIISADFPSGRLVAIQWEGGSTCTDLEESSTAQSNPKIGEGSALCCHTANVEKLSLRL